MSAVPTPAPVAVCPRCGQVHERCVAHNARGGPCGIRPIRGATVCRKHGGAAPQVRVAAAARLEARRVEHELGRALAELQAEVAQRGPEAVLLDQVWRAWAVAALLELRMAEAGESALEAEVGRELREWTREAARLSKLALDAGFEERRIELAEGMARELADVLRVGMGELVELVRQEVDDVALVRRLESAVPGLLRGAIERAHVIDVHEPKEA